MQCAMLLDLAHFVQTFLVTETVVCVAALDQFFRIGLEHSHALRLHIRTNRTADVRAFVPIQTGNTQGVVDHVNCAFHIALLVGILNSQNKIAVLFLGNQIGIQCRPQIADVHIARRTGRKSGSYSLVHCFELPFAFLS